MEKLTNLPAKKKATYHHGDLANTLKRVALEMIAKEGVEGFSLREAAKVVGVSPSAIYRHFPDKETLLSAIAQDGFVLLAEEFVKAMQLAAKARGMNTRERATVKFMAQGRSYIRFALANPSLFMVMFGPYCNSISVQSFEAAASSPYALLSAALDELMASGVLTSEHRQNLEIPVWSMVHGLANLLVTGALDPNEADSMIELVVQQLLRSLGLSIDGKQIKAAV